mgnify:CR=1
KTTAHCLCRKQRGWPPFLHALPKCEMARVYRLALFRGRCAVVGMGHSFLIQQSLAGETVFQNNQSIWAQFSS